jgi:hypothetical protein
VLLRMTSLFFHATACYISHWIFWHIISFLSFIFSNLVPSFFVTFFFLSLFDCWTSHLAHFQQSTLKTLTLGKLVEIQ